MDAVTLEGTIRRIDAPKSTVVLTGTDGKEVNVAVNPGAKVTLDGKLVTLANLRVGQRAKVNHYELPS